MTRVDAVRLVAVVALLVVAAILIRASTSAGQPETTCTPYGASSITAYRDGNGDVVVRVPVTTKGETCR